MKYSDNKHLCHLTVASCKPLIFKHGNEQFCEHYKSFDSHNWDKSSIRYTSAKS